MSEEFGGLVGGLIGLAVLATVAGSFFGKGASKAWNGAKETKQKITKGDSLWW
jgi:hypothetical protein